MAPAKKVAKKVGRKMEESQASLDDVMAELSTLSSGILSLVEVLRTPVVPPIQPALPPVEETPDEKLITKAGPKKFNEVNPEWEEKAQEILGDFLDHCEVEHIRSGGTIFTLVIKNEKSNASEEYLRMHGSDRRSKELGNEGLEGVEQWCKQVRANLNRPR